MSWKHKTEFWNKQQRVYQRLPWLGFLWDRRIVSHWGPQFSLQSFSTPIWPRTRSNPMSSRFDRLRATPELSHFCQVVNELPRDDNFNHMFDKQKNKDKERFWFLKSQPLNLKDGERIAKEMNLLAMIQVKILLHDSWFNNSWSYCRPFSSYSSHHFSIDVFLGVLVDLNLHHYSISDHIHDT